MNNSINKKEIAHFAKDSSHWWDSDGPFAILHRMGPVRMRYILSQTGNVADKSVLDIGCGGGLVCEPRARLGADVTGLDADAQAIEVAKVHAKGEELNIHYINESLESHLLSSRPRDSERRYLRSLNFARDDKSGYDIVLALEIIEHVDNPAEFIKNCAKALKPGGILIMSTLNRTPQSLVFGKFAAEYIANIVPKGTHDWKKFVKPSELSQFVRQAGLKCYRHHRANL